MAALIVVVALATSLAVIIRQEDDSQGEYNIWIYIDFILTLICFIINIKRIL